MIEASRVNMPPWIFDLNERLGFDVAICFKSKAQQMICSEWRRHLSTSQELGSFETSKELLTCVGTIVSQDESLVCSL